LPPSVVEVLGAEDREPFEQCVRKVRDTGRPSEVEVKSFAIGSRKGPAILVIEPITSGQGLVALSVRAKDSGGESHASRAKVN
jgi:hypothetical protein